jgi:hypothetical protein
MDKPFLRARQITGGVVAVACLAAAVSGTPSEEPAARGRDALARVGQPASPVAGTLPVVAEHRYRIAAKIRPLLLFWIGKDDVGGARIRWRKGENDARGYDVLIGSDPARAPRKINRWGFILEEITPEGATVVGIIKRSDEESLDEAKARVEAEAKGAIVFKMIRSAVGQTEAVSRLTTSTVTRDYSYRELDALADVLSKEAAPPKVQTIPMSPGVRPGLLSATTELLHDGVDAVKRTGKPPGRKTLSYVYYAKQYELTRLSAVVERAAAYGGVTYPTLLKSEFELRNPKESWAENFTIVCGVGEALAGVPVFLAYQPRWWFKVEMVLDERQVF